jgi:hypothetical protein
MVLQHGDPDVLHSVAGGCRGNRKRGFLAIVFRRVPAAPTKLKVSGLVMKLCWVVAAAPRATLTNDRCGARSPLLEIRR